MTYDQYLVYYDTCIAIQKYHIELIDIITRDVICDNSNQTFYPQITIKELGELISTTKSAFEVVDPGETIEKPNLRKLLKLSEADFKARAANLPSSPDRTLIKLTPAQFNYLKTGITDDSSSL